jgi:hypothetical protein
MSDGPQASCYCLLDFGFWILGYRRLGRMVLMARTTIPRPFPREPGQRATGSSLGRKPVAYAQITLLRSLPSLRSRRLVIASGASPWPTNQSPLLPYLLSPRGGRLNPPHVARFIRPLRGLKRRRNNRASLPGPRARARGYYQTPLTGLTATHRKAAQDATGNTARPTGGRTTPAADLGSSRQSKIQNPQSKMPLKSTASSAPS